ncbi:ABC transporter ATP-binding protein [Reyranella sp.]|uniref:ABC transporter ATP-binding protein n=1 Tax=Reyranella sp. TaxID=1929291 RepID=UPI003D0A51DD
MTPALQATGISVRYGGHVAVDRVDITVPDRGMVGVVGANGAGKSSLVNALAGWSPGDRPTVRGSVQLGGKRMDGLAPHRRARRGLVLVPQGKAIFADLTVAENLALMRPPLRKAGRHAFSMDEIFALFPRLADRRNHKGGMLTGSERQMVAVGRALRAAPRVLLLDEPSAGQTPHLLHELLATLRRLIDAGLSVLLVEQSVRSALELVDALYLLERGKVAAHGPAGTMRDDPRLVEASLGRVPS